VSYQTVVKRALEQLRLEMQLCRYLTLCCGNYTDYHRMSKKRLATLPSDFLATILEIVFKCIEEESPRTDDDWCELHEYEKDDEREECRAARASDPDVRPCRPFMGRTRGCY
jgi:hypothetical protein